MENIITLGESLPLEIQRCQELVREYGSLGAVGAFGAAMITQDIRRAQQATADGDVVAMLRAYNILKECQ